MQENYKSASSNKADLRYRRSFLIKVDKHILVIDFILNER
jgi:hypothetical protein